MLLLVEAGVAKHQPGAIGDVAYQRRFCVRKRGAVLVGHADDQGASNAAAQRQGHGQSGLRAGHIDAVGSAMTLRPRMGWSGGVRMVPAGATRRRVELLRRAAGVVVDRSPLDIRLAREALACGCPTWVLASDGVNLQQARV